MSGKVNGVEFGKLDNDVDGVIRLYNKVGEHVASILPCSDDCADLATPDGKVLYCGVDYDLVRQMSKILTLESF